MPRRGGLTVLILTDEARWVDPTLQARISVPYYAGMIFTSLLLFSMRNTAKVGIMGLGRIRHDQGVLFVMVCMGSLRR